MWQLKRRQDGEEQKERTEVERMGFRVHRGRQVLERARATTKLALEQKTLGLWEKAWSGKKTGRELHAICPKPTKKTLKLHKDLSKAASALII